MIFRDLMRILARRVETAATSHRGSVPRLRFDLPGEASEIQVGVFLTALRWKGVTVEELTASARRASSRDDSCATCRTSCAFVRRTTVGSPRRSRSRPAPPPPRECAFC